MLSFWACYLRMRVLSAKTAVRSISFVGTGGRDGAYRTFFVLCRGDYIRLFVTADIADADFDTACGTGCLERGFPLAVGVGFAKVGAV